MGLGPGNYVGKKSAMDDVKSDLPYFTSGVSFVNARVRTHNWSPTTLCGTRLFQPFLLGIYSNFIAITLSHPRL